MEVDDGGLKMNADNGQHLPSPSQRLGKQTSTSSYMLVSPRCSTSPLFQEMLDLATSPLCYSTDVSVGITVLLLLLLPPMTDDESHTSKFIYRVYTYLYNYFYAHDISIPLIHFM